MSDVYAAVCSAAREIVKSSEESLRERIRAGAVIDEDSLTDAIHEEADSAVIYTFKQYILAWGLCDEEDAIEEGLSSPTNFGEALVSQAYLNLRCALSRIDFSDAFAVASDAVMESEGGES